MHPEILTHLFSPSLASACSQDTKESLPMSLPHPIYLFSFLAIPHCHNTRFYFYKYLCRSGGVEKEYVFNWHNFQLGLDP